MAMLIAIAFAALGCAMIVIGWRGRRIDDHPLCRACGFDLVGRAPESTRCAECGAHLDLPRAIRVGHRVRRAGLLVSGIALFLPAALVLGTITMVTARGIDLTPYKPDWLLAREVNGPANPSAGKSLAELTKRVQAGTVADRHIASVTATCLAKQGQPQLAWDPAWGRFIEAARAAGKLSDERWATYAQQAFVLTLTTDRAGLSRGASIPNPMWSGYQPTKSVSVYLNTPRVGGASFVAYFDWASMWIDDDAPQPPSRFGLDRPRPFHGRLEARPGGWGASQSVPQLPTAAGQRIAAGDHTFYGVLRVHIYDAKDVPSRLNAAPPNQPPPPAAKQITEMGVDLSVPFKVAEPVEPQRRDTVDGPFSVDVSPVPRGPMSGSYDTSTSSFSLRFGIPADA